MTLHSCVIVPENLVKAMLATTPSHPLELAREKAAVITARTGFTSHPLTIHAAAHMVNLVERAERLRRCETL